MPNESGGGPYRELFVDPNAEALEKMKKEIEAEGNHPILLLDNTEHGDQIPELIKLLKKKVKPENIAPYSSDTGVLSLTDHWKGRTGSTTFKYWNESSGSLLLITFYKKTTHFTLRIQGSLVIDLKEE